MIKRNPSSGSHSFRLLSALIVLALLICAAPVHSSSADHAFAYTDVQDARLRALDCLMICGFSVEWNAAGTANAATVLTRWEIPIKICLTGSPSADDRNQLNQFIMELATHCPNIPNISVVDNEQSANIVIYYGPLNTLPQHVDYYHEGNWGAFSYHYEGNAIVSGKIGIATDKNNKASKRHLLREELTGLLGLTNDHEIYSDSILYQQWTTVGQLSDVDWLMLNMLYDPDLSCGMSAAQAYKILQDKILK